MRSTTAAVRLSALVLLGALTADAPSRAGSVPADGLRAVANGFEVGGSIAAVATSLTGLTAAETYAIDFDPSAAAGRQGDDAAYDGPDVFDPTAAGSVAVATFQGVRRRGIDDGLPTIDDVVVASVGAAGSPAVAPEPAAIALMTIATAAAAGFASHRRRRLTPAARPRRGR